MEIYPGSKNSALKNMADFILYYSLLITGVIAATYYPINQQHDQRSLGLNLIIVFHVLRNGNCVFLYWNLGLGDQRNIITRWKLGQRLFQNDVSRLGDQNLLVYFVWCCGWCYHLCNLGFRDGIYEWDSRDRNWFSYHHLLSDLWTFMYLSVKVLLLIRISKNGNSCQDLISQ